MQCPLCRTHTNRWYFEDDKRSYKRCDCCNLVFVPAAYHVSPEREKAEYDLHLRGIAVAPTPSREALCPAWVQQGFVLYRQLADLGYQPFPAEEAACQWRRR